LAVYNPGDATFITIIGPTGVGKTTLIHWLKRAIEEAQSKIVVPPDHIPCVHIDPSPSTMGRFDWIDYYLEILLALGDPFIDSTGKASRNIRRAMEKALLRRKPVAVITDEAQYLAKVASGRKLQDQLDHIKYLGDKTKVIYVLVGPYDMRTFRTANAQLGRRSLDIHFARYDALNGQDLLAFKSIVWAFQRNLPLPVEPDLKDKELEYLYTRTIGCVGSLKQWLLRALTRALIGGGTAERTLTHAHLKATAMPKVKVESAFREALEGERDMREPEDADERLLELVGFGRQSPNVAAPTPASPIAANGEDAPKPRGKVGERSPQRDPIGTTAGDA